MKPNYTYKDIVEKLYAIGIKKGDDVFIHSNLGFYGVLDSCESAEELCKAFLLAILEVIGNNGTIITPTYSYSYCHGQVYDPLTTKTTCGMLSTYMIKKYPTNRTLDPNFSICGIGKNIEEYKKCNIHETFGQGSFWESFKINEGKIICMNFDAGSTFVHYIERQNNVNYRYNKAFNGQTIINGRIYKDYAVHFVYDGENNAPCMERVDDLCRRNQICKEAFLGKGTILAFSVTEYYNFFTELLKVRPRVFCKVENI